MRASLDRCFRSNVLRIFGLGMMCFAIAAAEDECTIHLVVSEDEGGEEGEGEEGEGEGEGCSDDSECEPGQLCVLVANCPPCERDDWSMGTCECVEQGRCIAPEPPLGGECRSDADCGEGAACDFSRCDEPTEPGDPNGGSAPIVCDVGFCVPIDDGCICPDGSPCRVNAGDTSCEPSGCANGEVCPEGTHCEEVTTCDRLAEENGGPRTCVLSFECVPDWNDECPAQCGPGGTCVIHDDGTVSCIYPEPPRAECRSDADCVVALGVAVRCNAEELCLPPPDCDASSDQACTQECWGQCIYDDGTPCFEDADCADGEICVLVDTCPPCVDENPACLLPCVVEGRCVSQDPTRP